MSRKGLIERYIRWEEGALSPAEADRLRADRRFDEADRAQRFVRQILCVKRHERPDPSWETRNAAAVLRRIRSREAERTAAAPAALRWLLAAAALVAVAVPGFLVLRSAQIGRATSSFLADRAAPRTDPDSPVLATRPPTNGVAPVQYGPAPSRLVDFEY
jgi:hypothetical protein